DRINDSATDDVALRATSTSGTNASTRALIFAGDVSLSTRRSIWLGGPTIAIKPGSIGTVRLSSEYIAFNARNSPSETPVATSPFPQNLAGSLIAQADLIDIGYGVNFGCGSPQCIAAGLNRGFADVQLISRGDIRLNSEGLIPPSASPRLSAGGTLTLS